MEIKSSTKNPLLSPSLHTENNKKTQKLTRPPVDVKGILGKRKTPPQKLNQIMFVKENEDEA